MSLKVCFALLAVPVLFTTGCAEPTLLGTAESEQRSSSKCAFIPGSAHLTGPLSCIGASDGPLSAGVATYEDAQGNPTRALTLTYNEAVGSSFLLCSRFPNQPDITILFVVGPENARTSVTRPMKVSCPTSYGDNVSQTDSAFVSVVENEDPELWDALFPPHADGSRWYALQVAAVNAHGEWDSRHGENYRLVLQ